MDHQLDKEIQFDPVPPLEFLYQKISVQALVEKEVSNGQGGYKKQKASKVILKECSGKFSPKTMTAILGPSGSGKTTMLNLLSGRLLSKNLTLRGQIKINGKVIDTMQDYKGVIGYVMQDDAMLATFTPRQTFKFIADMRLPHKSEEQKNFLTESMLKSLGLTKCAQTYIGNSLIRGLSGGQRKRTSVGFQLLINPSLIFLDQPTTGLDSTTSLNLIKFLNRLSHSGRTIITTIHQPSSQIFQSFDLILLLLEGHVVYHDLASKSMDYFSKIGMPVPLHSNPMDHYMKLMNKEGISMRKIHEGKTVIEQQVKKQFQQRIELLVSTYKQNFKMPKNQVVSIIQNEGHQASWCQQTVLLFKRSVINQLRNPIGLRAKIFQMIFFAIVTIILYQRKASSLNNYLQNIRGLLFFVVMSMGFAGMFGSLNIFSQQRPVFIRQRLSDTYRTTSYFAGRSLAYIPLELFLPVLYVCICYFAVNLQYDGNSFFLTIASSWLSIWMGSAYGLVLSTGFSDPQVALALVPVIIVPLMIVGNFFAPNQLMPDFFRIFQYISPYKYHFQSLIYAQFMDRRDTWSKEFNGTVYTFNGDIMGYGKQLYFEQPFWLSMFLMGIIGLALRFLALLCLYLISNPHKIKLEPSALDNKNEKKDETYKQIIEHKIQSQEKLQFFEIKI